MAFQRLHELHMQCGLHLRMLGQLVEGERESEAACVVAGDHEHEHVCTPLLIVDVARAVHEVAQDRRREFSRGRQVVMRGRPAHAEVIEHKLGNDHQPRGLALCIARNRREPRQPATADRVNWPPERKLNQHCRQDGQEFSTHAVVRSALRLSCGELGLQRTKLKAAERRVTYKVDHQFAHELGRVEGYSLHCVLPEKRVGFVHPGKGCG
mmetsp:Transcript_36375/g.60274  ORF Transcript_36375/g.60274 Transcript_36375/m.60274 type:complete len:210 (-) Transcript_36375:528-1157(-)